LQSADVFMCMNAQLYAPIQKYFSNRFNNRRKVDIGLYESLIHFANTCTRETQNPEFLHSKKKGVWVMCIFVIQFRCRDPPYTPTVSDILRHQKNLGGKGK